MDKLLPYQQQHAKSLINILGKNKRVLDASKMGLGKTYCNVAVCVELKLIPFIVCIPSYSSTELSTHDNKCILYVITMLMKSSRTKIMLRCSEDQLHIFRIKYSKPKKLLLFLTEICNKRRLLHQK